MILQMSQSLIFFGLFVVLLALVPVGLKWIQHRSVGGGGGIASSSRIISAVAVGQHQRVVTVEVGPEGARVWLTLGVTAQSITCLHSSAIDSNRDAGPLQPIATQPVLP
jgi:flagellar protein FliO/FliZ